MKRKKKVSKKPAVSRVVKPYNAGTMSNAAFWGMIRSMLRRKTMFGWKPITNVRNAAKIPYTGGRNKRQRFSYVCNKCHLPWSLKEVSVHHKIECGRLSCPEDLPGFVMRLFCEEEHLELICNKCHDKEHKK